MTEDQGRKKSQNISDATVKKDSAIPAKPTALSDKDLEKVAGGINSASATNFGNLSLPASNTFKK